MNKNQKLFDQIATSLKYTKLDDFHYLSELGTQLRLTKRGFVTFSQFRVGKGSSNDLADYIKHMEEFWQL